VGLVCQLFPKAAWHVKKYLFWPYQFYARLIYIPLACVLTLIAGWTVVLVSMAVNPNFASRHIAMRWARLLSRLLPISVTVEGAENIQVQNSYVVVSNHLSMVDILALYGYLDLDLKWVIKKELRNMPGVGIGCEKAGHIFVDRENPDSAKRSVNAALERLGEGVGILFFAEGTRSRDGKLLPFKKGAFRIAIDADLPILPVTIVGTREILPAKTLRLYPGRVRVVVHPVIEHRNTDLEHIRDLMVKTRDVIASALPEECRAAT
jgi:1-acyl-sn-glycerol-3-phosphate acyltransferase